MSRYLSPCPATACAAAEAANPPNVVLVTMLEWAGAKVDRQPPLGGVSLALLLDGAARQDYDGTPVTASHGPNAGPHLRRWRSDTTPRS